MALLTRGRTPLAVAASMCLIGAIDAALDSAWDQVALFLGAASMVALALLRQQPHRRAMTLRSDLFAWLLERSRLTGEPVEVMADRAVAAHRAGLTGPQDGERQ
jgi:hypothetical protein